jgi:hypothetical protein
LLLRSLQHNAFFPATCRLHDRTIALQIQGVKPMGRGHGTQFSIGAAGDGS